METNGARCSLHCRTHWHRSGCRLGLSRHFDLTHQWFFNQFETSLTLDGRYCSPHFLLSSPFLVPFTVLFCSCNFNSHRDVIKGMSKAMESMGYYLVLVFFAAPFYGATSVIPIFVYLSPLKVQDTSRHCRTSRYRWCHYLLCDGQSSHRFRRRQMADPLVILCQC